MFESGHFSGFSRNFALYSPMGGVGSGGSGTPVSAGDAPAKAMALAAEVLEVALVAMDWEYVVR